MTITEQTASDIKSMLEITDQRIHEMSGTAEAVNSYNPTEVAAMYDLRDHLRGLLPD